MVNPFSNRRRLVRLHLQNGVTLDRSGITESPGVTIEGILVARTRWDYILVAAKLIEGPEQTIPLEGGAEVERARVLFKQVMD